MERYPLKENGFFVQMLVRRSNSNSEYYHREYYLNFDVRKFLNLTTTDNISNLWFIDYVGKVIEAASPHPSMCLIINHDMADSACGMISAKVKDHEVLLTQLSALFEAEIIILPPCTVAQIIPQAIIALERTKIKNEISQKLNTATPPSKAKL